MTAIIYSTNENYPFAEKKDLSEKKRKEPKKKI
jgi:hypothetical protein